MTWFKGVGKNARAAVRVVNTDLAKKLYLPLAILTIASIVGAVFVPWQGLFVSLATAFIGIAVTVPYVDYSCGNRLTGMSRIAASLAGMMCPIQRSPRC